MPWHRNVEGLRKYAADHHPEWDAATVAELLALVEAGGREMQRLSLAPARVIETPLDVFTLIFSQANPANLLAFGSRRPTARGGHDPHYLFPIPVGELREWLPGVLEYEPEHTQYATMRSTFKRACLLAPLDKYRKAFTQGHPKYFAVTRDHVAQICAVGIDLDVGREDLPSAEIALGVVMDRARKGELPWPHLAALSGRGLYILWLLTDETGQAPVQVDDHHVAAFMDITRGLCRRLDRLHLSPDEALSIRPEGWLKRPGTVDTKTGREVVYAQFGSEGSIPARYRLKDLAQRLALVMTPKPVVPKPDVARDNRHRRGRGRVKDVLGRSGRGYGQAARVQLDLVAWVNDHDGIVPVGMRYHFLWTWYCVLCRRGHPWAEALRLTRKLSERHCEPGGGGLPNVGRFRFHLRNTSWTQAHLSGLASALKISEGDAERLELRELLPWDLRERRKAERLEVRRLRAEHFALVRRVAGGLLRANPQAGNEHIAEAVRVSVKGPCSRKHVENIRRELGIRANPPHRTGKARK